MKVCISQKKNNSLRQHLWIVNGKWREVVPFDFIPALLIYDYLFHIRLSEKGEKCSTFPPMVTHTTLLKSTTRKILLCLVPKSPAVAWHSLSPHFHLQTLKGSAVTSLMVHSLMKEQLSQKCLHLSALRDYFMSNSKI